MIDVGGYCFTLPLWRECGVPEGLELKGPFGIGASAGNSAFLVNLARSSRLLSAAYGVDGC